jgi:hypothetical protein
MERASRAGATRPTATCHTLDYEAAALWPAATGSQDEAHSPDAPNSALE